MTGLVLHDWLVLHDLDIYCYSDLTSQHTTEHRYSIFRKHMWHIFEMMILNIRQASSDRPWRRGEIPGQAGDDEVVGAGDDRRCATMCCNMSHNKLDYNGLVKIIDFVRILGAVMICKMSIYRMMPQDFPKWDDYNKPPPGHDINPES